MNAKTSLLYNLRQEVPSSASRCLSVSMFYASTANKFVRIVRPFTWPSISKAFDTTREACRSKPGAAQSK